MSVSDQIPPTEWVSLKHGGEEIAEAWFMPEGGRFTVVFLVPRRQLEVADPGRRVTVETLLTAASIPEGDVESWRLGDVPDSGAGGPNPDSGHPLPPPAPDETHLTVYVHLKPARPPAGGGTGGRSIPPEQWQALEALWKAILGLEASIEASRLGMDGLRAEMEAAFGRSLAAEEKLHAPQADVAQWNKAKGRIHYAVPKVREFIHRATWALAVPERKRLEEIVRTHIEPRTPFPEVDAVREQLEHLQKDRQVLFAQGNAVQQECRGILAELQAALNTLRRNAADRARQKRGAGQKKGKYF